MVLTLCTSLRTLSRRVFLSCNSSQCWTKSKLKYDIHVKKSRAVTASMKSRQTDLHFIGVFQPKLLSYASKFRADALLDFCHLLLVDELACSSNARHTAAVWAFTHSYVTNQLSITILQKQTITTTCTPDKYLALIFCFVLKKTKVTTHLNSADSS